MLTVGAVKVFLDGSAGGRTAWMSKPYLGDDDNIGVQILPDAELEALVLDAHKKVISWLATLSAMQRLDSSLQPMKRHSQRIPIQIAAIVSNIAVSLRRNSMSG